MLSDFLIHFQYSGKKYDVDLKPEDGHKGNECVTIGGIHYSLRGDFQGIEIVKKCLAELPENSKATQSLAGRELKARLWLAGAKDIQLSGCEETHKMGLQILGDIEPLNLNQTIEDLCLSLEKYYIFPSIAKKCGEYLRNQLKEGAYDAVEDPETFAQMITSDLRLISNDRHIRFCLNDSHSLINEETSIETESLDEQYPTPLLLDSFEYKPNSNIGWMGASLIDFPYELKAGFLEKDEKIGYLDLRLFGVCKSFKDDKDIEVDFELELDIKARRNAFIEVAKKLKNAESIIIDLRNNGGGRPDAVQLLCSLFNVENLPLNTIEWRKGEIFEKEDFNTLPDNVLPEDIRLLNQKVFVLISPGTFSAAEEFANNMKVLGRASIVGEPSGGAANPGGPDGIGKHFEIFIPQGQAINPIEEGNWEGVGITPDHMISAEKALDEAIELTKK